MATNRDFWGSFNPSQELKDRQKGADSVVTVASEVAINPVMPSPNGDGYTLKALPATNVPVSHLESVLFLNPVHYFQLNDESDPIEDFMGNGSGVTGDDGIFGEPGLNDGTAVTLPAGTSATLALSEISSVSPISVSFYMNTATPTTAGYILTIPRGEGLLGLTLDTGGILIAELETGDATPMFRTVSSLAAVTGVSTHIVVTDDGTDLKLYVDGVEQ